MVPELTKDQQFSSPRASRSRNTRKPKRWVIRPPCAGRAGHVPQAGEKQGCGFNPLSLLDRLLPVYIDVLRELAYRGAEWVQLDEPCLVLDLDIVAQQALHYAYTEIANAVPQLKIMLATYSAGWAATATPRWRCPSPACISI